ncbi:tRNA (guanosine(37)-N1)-methyltransferase TrmD [Polynucleobacter sp. IMCC30063]|uniref:tRNA (guanosine(37)-N1)-methyltransferase TrmD n=1 Tax=unclassified Polynucleobacter TaxID=2640945 RepID=UPI001F1F5ED4|nr:MULTISPECIES: tRNA (guanosine(37)-N1)-methyltransferase TrmD [unclassified Polynucleobacter]MCE7506380.1 tRNA (guanosine(37)-N1)-methyltransferase TrmD [Polynucleobacter sp. IMCC30063]MCE7527652.1 tRNA (guanosine(37)-N1)-methyltransferase TrmD [Polynucleobacter sp. IMCC 30228]MCE7529470.1 tRNA (guanosine(37)-N1)-methyltransferase TrmD [Polynucleobacter sp. IMCC 29146]
MRFDVVTIFPEMFSALTKWGVTGRACEHQLTSVSLWNPRDFSTDARKTVDDRAYGGGPGMVMMAKPLEDAVEAIQAQHQQLGIRSGPVCLLAPQGKAFSQQIAADILNYGNLTLICGRYEAVDQRFIERKVDLQLSLGDFVLSGGELPAMAMMDAVIRLIPGALGDQESAAQDSFINGLLDYPHYTRPEIVGNLSVPDVLLGGHHAKIMGWRRQQSLALTKRLRPDLIESARAKGLLSQEDEQFLHSLA